MVIAIVVDHYSEFTGYTENCLPKFLTKLGAKVHVVCPNVKPYFNDPWYDQTYLKFYGPPVVDPGVSIIDGVSIHRLPHRMRFGYVEAEDLIGTIKSIKPDIVQCLASMSWNLLKLARFRCSVGYKLFTGNHMALSVFRPLKTKMSFPQKTWFYSSRRLIGSYIARETVKCFSASEEGAMLCVKYYGIPKTKVVVLPLGVDTDQFHPCETESEFSRRISLRRDLGCGEGDVLCVYTGRFTEAKNPIVLAKAIDALRKKGFPFSGLFIGGGPQVDRIATCKGCQILDFVPWSHLGEYYRASDIAIWPQEESMSSLDAAATGIPVVLSDRIKVRERVEGNGRTYPHGSYEGLAEVLADLNDMSVRNDLGTNGMAKMRRMFSWSIHAERRMRYYNESLSK
jgi:glycosyltransferase involved in cell wall biosynthesis